MPTDVLIAAVTSAGATPPHWPAEIEAGMREYFPQYSWQTLFLDEATPVYPWQGSAGKAHGYRAVFEQAERCGAAACLLLDARHAGFERDWIDAFLRPALHAQCDRVTPRYHGDPRHALLSQSLLAPMLLALFGRAPRLPLAGDFLLSRPLLRQLLARNDWDSAPARQTPELWLEFASVASSVRPAETRTGPVTAFAPAPPASPSAAFAQIAGSLFQLMEQYEPLWLAAPALPPIDHFGEWPRAAALAAPHAPDGLNHLVQFADAFAAFAPYWQRLLDARTMANLARFHQSLAAGDLDQPLPGAVWVRLVYEMAAAWKHRRMPRQQVLHLLRPLYLARVGSFLLETRRQTPLEIEARLARQRELFQTLRPVLSNFWFSPTASATAPGHARPRIKAPWRKAA